jgi:magnesium transporter
MPPGTPVFVGQQRLEKVRLTVIDYSEDKFTETDVESPQALFRYRDQETATWINITGVHDVETIAGISDHFGLHPLVQEDIANTMQRPKIEDYESYFYIVLRMLQYDKDENQIQSEQVSLILAPTCVITFQEREGDVFEAVRERIRNNKGRIRKLKADYLFYSLLDAIIDGYFDVLEQIGGRVEIVEAAVMRNPVPATLAEIHELRTQVVFLRKSVWPLREAMNTLEKTESALVNKSTRVFLRDTYDHTIHLIDTIETYRDVAASLFEMYLSMVSNRMNEVMKVLTIIATIFIPITFVAGIYGMNFEHMPELGVSWAYPAVWGVMIGIVLVMLAYFKRKNWI